MGSSQQPRLQLAERPEWTARLAALPARPPSGSSAADPPIPAFFFAHGHPGVVFGSETTASRGLQTVDGTLHQFLQDFGPALLEKYRPKAIVVFSAHWESTQIKDLCPTHYNHHPDPARVHNLVTDYGDDQPLLYDYYGFPRHFYEAKWHSNGSTELTERVVASLKEAGIDASRTTRAEPRGQDGVLGPAPGLDHGVFIPFMLMFPEGKEHCFPIPIVQVSIDGSLDPARNIRLGQALAALRHEDILILSGGLTIHTFEAFEEWRYETSTEPVKRFEREILQACTAESVSERFQRMIELSKLEGFRRAHPRAEHFVPIYIAAGAGSDAGRTQVISDIHGCQTIAFGVV